MKHRKLIITASIVAVVGLGAFGATRFAGTGNAGQPTAVAEAAPEQAPAAQPSAGEISVDGRVVPAQRADLSMAVPGIVAEVLVKEGQQVGAGQPLLRLKALQQQTAVAQAEAQLARAQARLDELKAGAREQEVAAAQAALDATQARLDRIEKGPLPAETAAARAALAESQAGLEGLLEGADGVQLIAAQADLANAQAVLRQAQTAYDKVAGDPEIGARPEAVQLEQATNAYTAAQARFDDLKQGASTATIAGGRARVQRAQAQLNLLSATNPADVAEAQAAVRQAQAQLDLLAAGVRPETIAVAEAEVAAARAAVDQAKAALSDAELLAPFAGAVASVDINTGEQVAAGVPVIRLASLGKWQIETEDLTEFDVVGLKPGDKVALTFDALPDLRQDGVINRIRPIGQDNRGDIVYTLVIDPAQQDERLLWNMTAVVTVNR